MIYFQTGIDQPTQELSGEILKNLTESKETNMLIDGYRQMKRQMAEAEVQQKIEEFVAEIQARDDYKTWLADALKKDEHRRKKRVPESDLQRVKLFINQKKSSLAAVILTAFFTESVDQWKRKGLWRTQSHGYLTGFAVLDADHVPNPEERIKEWIAREDFKDLGITWIFITPSGEGIKVVFKAREEWGNLQDNVYQMAEILGVLDYADGQCKNADHAHFIPKASDIKYIDWEELFTYSNPAYEQRYGEAYRRGESEPTQPRWQEFEGQRKKARKAVSTIQQSSPITQQPTSITLTDRDKAIIEALNGHYGEKLPEGRRHETWLGETAPWLLLLCDNNAEKAVVMGRELSYVKHWTDQTANELENCVATVQKKPLLTYRPKRLKEILQKAGIDTDTEGNVGCPEEELPFDEWIEQIRSYFDVFPCIREICEPHPERLWPFLLFASAALFGTNMTLCWYYFYDQPEKPRRLNYNVLGIGDPASGKGALVRISNLITEPIEQADQLVNDSINAWKEEHRSKGVNKDKAQKPKGIVRLHGARTSNNVFINDMNNAFVEIDGERMHMHMLTVDTEALNAIKMQKGGSWIDKQVLEIKAWSNEKDSQQYANMDSVTGFFNVYWNLVRTCTPPALKLMANERNFGTGWPTRVSPIPVPGTGFKMMELRRHSKTVETADETLRAWAYKLDKRRGELPLWKLVEHAWHWTDNRMEVAAFNNDKGDELLLKRCAPNSLAIVAPFVDMRHWEEREKNGTYEPDEQDVALLNTIIDIQYRTQHYWFGELARNYFDEQMKDATLFRRRTTRFEQCYQQLPEEFNTEQFSQIFGYANPHSAAKTLERFVKDKVIVRKKRGEYRKRVQNIF